MRRPGHANVGILVTALVTASVTAAAPSIAAVVKKALFANNAGKVDGFDAIPFTNKASKRAGKLAAVGDGGFLPNNIISRSPNAAKLKGLPSGRYLDHGANTVVVDKGGIGDFSSIQAAIDSIADASADNPYTVLVLSGIYDEKVTLKAFVTLQGAGSTRPIITCACASAEDEPVFGSAGTVVMKGNATLSHVEVRNTGGSFRARGIEVQNQMNLIYDVVVSAETDFESQATAIYAPGAGLTIHGTEARAMRSGFSEGLLAPMGNITTLDSSFTSGEEYASRSYGGVVNEGGSLNATRTTFEARNGSQENVGLALGSSGVNAIVDSVIASSANDLSASPAGFQQGAASTRFEGTRIRVTGASHNAQGVWNSGGTIDATSVVVYVSGATEGNFGWTNANPDGTKIVSLHRSAIEVAGPGFTITQQAGYTMRIGMSRIAGPNVSNFGNLECAGVYDENFAFTPGCPA